jgi:16S rRNA G966 N2-methylase RsmD
VLRALAGSGHLAASAIARQAAAALVMDTTDMTFDDQRLRLPEQLRPTPIAGLS